MSTNEGKCVLVEVGALIGWCIYSYRIVMLLVPYMWASMTFLPYMWASMTFWPKKHSNVHSSLVDYCSRVTEHSVMKIPFSLQLTSISLTSDANLKPVY